MSTSNSTGNNRRFPKSPKNLSKFESNQLNTYDAQVSCGIVHTKAWKLKMVALQSIRTAFQSRKIRVDDALESRTGGDTQ